MEIRFGDPVCFWCDVYNRVACERLDEDGKPEKWDCCAYCGGTWIRLGKRGRQTPRPRDDDFPL
jgi:hypothetical protein